METIEAENDDGGTVVNCCIGIFIHWRTFFRYGISTILLSIYSPVSSNNTYVSIGLGYLRQGRRHAEQTPIPVLTHMYLVWMCRISEGTYSTYVPTLLPYSLSALCSVLYYISCSIGLCTLSVLCCTLLYSVGTEWLLLPLSRAHSFSRYSTVRILLVSISSQQGLCRPLSTGRRDQFVSNVCMYIQLMLRPSRKWCSN